jgi:hypothetical protein
MEREKIRTGAEIFKKLVNGIFPSTRIMKTVNAINARGVQKSFTIQRRINNGIGAMILLMGLSLFRNELLS